MLWRALETTKETSTEIAAALRQLLLVGQRPGEVAGALQAELKNIDDPKNARWEIDAGRMKARRGHVVPLAPMARELFRDMLARRREEGDKTSIFASRFSGRTTLARHSLSQALRRVIARLKPEGADADPIGRCKPTRRLRMILEEPSRPAWRRLAFRARTVSPSLPTKPATFTAPSMTNTSGCAKSGGHWKRGSATSPRF